MAAGCRGIVSKAYLPRSSPSPDFRPANEREGNPGEVVRSPDPIHVHLFRPRSVLLLKAVLRSLLQIINYDSTRGGVSVVTEKGDSTTSFLLLQEAKPSDSGQYTCNPSNADPKSITVHVLNGEWFLCLIATVFSVEYRPGPRSNRNHRHAAFLSSSFHGIEEINNWPILVARTPFIEWINIERTDSLRLGYSI